VIQILCDMCGAKIKKEAEVHRFTAIAEAVPADAGEPVRVVLTVTGELDGFQSGKEPASLCREYIQKVVLTDLVERQERKKEKANGLREAETKGEA